jgi:hypothetical protein
MMGRRIKESFALIDIGVVVEEVDSSLRLGDGECLLEMDSGPKCSTDFTTSGLLVVTVNITFLILRILCNNISSKQFRMHSLFLSCIFAFIHPKCTIL